MCTATTIRNKDFYFGRNLDLGSEHGGKVLGIPRALPLSFRYTPGLDHHEAMIGMGVYIQGFPLFYDGANESGLAIAGLNFPENAVYGKPEEGKTSIPSFEFIPWLLTHATSVQEVREILENDVITDDAFAPGFPVSTLHWMVSD